MNADTPSSAAPAPAPKKPRNSAEFWLVRGGIAVLVLLAAVQAHARFGYEMTLKKMQNRIALEEETAKPLLVSEAKEMIQGFPSATEVSDRHWIQRTYTWRGLTQSYKIILNFDNSEPQPAVMSLLTGDAPPPPPEPVVEEGDPPPWPTSSMGGAGGPGMGGPGMGGMGMGGGGPRPDPMANDKDGDGKLSKEEAPERMAANFADWDANSDGFVDKDEIEAARARFRAQRGNGGPGGGGPSGGGGRPQRPAAEGDKPTETPASTPETDKPAPAAEEKPADAAAAKSE